MSLFQFCLLVCFQLLEGTGVGPRNNTLGRRLQTTSGHDPISSTSNTPKGGFWQAQDSAGVISGLWGQPCTATHMLWVESILTVSQSKGQYYPWLDQQQSRSNYNKRVHKPHKEHFWNTYLGWSERLPLSPTRHFLHKATIPRLEGIKDLPNTKKQMQRCSQNGETSNHIANETIGEILRGEKT